MGKRALLTIVAAIIGACGPMAACGVEVTIDAAPGDSGASSGDRGAPSDRPEGENVTLLPFAFDGLEAIAVSGRVVGFAEREGLTWCERDLCAVKSRSIAIFVGGGTRAGTAVTNLGDTLYAITGEALLECAASTPAQDLKCTTLLQRPELMVGSQLVVDSRSFAWMNSGFVWRLPRSSGPSPLRLAEPNTARLALAADRLLIGKSSRGTVTRVDNLSGVLSVDAGGEVQQPVLLESVTDPRSLAIDGPDFYVAIPGVAGRSDGLVVKCSIELGCAQSRVDFVQGLDEPDGLALDATHVYWTEVGSGRLRKAPKAGGPPVTLAEGLVRPTQVVVDAQPHAWVMARRPGAEAERVVYRVKK